MEHTSNVELTATISPPGVAAQRNYRGQEAYAAMTPLLRQYARQLPDSKERRTVTFLPGQIIAFGVKGGPSWALSSNYAVSFVPSSAGKYSNGQFLLTLNGKKCPCQLRKGA